MSYNKVIENMLYEYPKLKIEVRNLYIELEEFREVMGRDEDF